jgi:hypothetical protein
MQPRYIEQSQRLVKTCWEEFTEDQPERVKLFEQGGWILEAELYESKEVLLRGREQAIENTIRAFFIDRNDDPVLFHYFSFIDSQIWLLANPLAAKNSAFPSTLSTVSISKTVPSSTSFDSPSLPSKRTDGPGIDIDSSRRRRLAGS